MEKQYRAIAAAAEDSASPVGELTTPTRTKTGIFDNEASAVDLAVYDALKPLDWSRENGRD